MEAIRLITNRVARDAYLFLNDLYQLIEKRSVMHKLGSKLLSLIENECRGKKHIKLTIGTLANGRKNIQVFGDTGEIPNGNYTYEIASITKTFTASLLGKYLYEDKMSLEDSISKYVEGLDNSVYYPTLKRLATHTSGYAHFPATIWDGVRAFLEPVFTGARNGGRLPHFIQINEENMKKLLSEKKVDNKDYPWAYSNFGMGLVGYAVGVASSRGYVDAMNDYLANDLGMKNSFIGIKPDINLHGYAKKNKDIGNWDFSDSIAAGTGGISSTVEDMLTYASIQMNEEHPYLKLCHEKHVSINKMSDMGLGWLLKSGNNHVIMHTGGSGGFNNFLVIDKKKKTAYIMLANYLVSLGKFVMAILNDLESR